MKSNSEQLQCSILVPKHMMKHTSLFSVEWWDTMGSKCYIYCQTWLFYLVHLSNYFSYKDRLRDMTMLQNPKNISKTLEIITVPHTDYKSYQLKQSCRQSCLTSKDQPHLVWREDHHQSDHNITQIFEPEQSLNTMFEGHCDPLPLCQQEKDLL